MYKVMLVEREDAGEFVRRLEEVLNSLNQGDVITRVEYTVRELVVGSKLRLVYSALVVYQSGSR